MKAESALKLIQGATPLCQLHANLRHVYLSHRMLSKLPPCFPKGRDFQGNGLPTSEIFLNLFFHEQIEITSDVLIKKTVGWALIAHGAHKKKLKVPLEAFLLRHVNAEGYMEYRSLGCIRKIFKGQKKEAKARKILSCSPSVLAVGCFHESPVPFAL